MIWESVVEEGIPGSQRGEAREDAKYVVHVVVEITKMSRIEVQQKPMSFCINDLPNFV